MAFQLDHIIDSGPHVDSTKLSHSQQHTWPETANHSRSSSREPSQCWFDFQLFCTMNKSIMVKICKQDLEFISVSWELRMIWEYVVFSVYCVYALSYACTLNWGYKFRLVTHEQQHRTPDKSLCTVQLNGKGERARDCPKCLLGFHFYFILFHFFPLLLRDSSHEEKLALIYIADEYKWKNV